MKLITRFFNEGLLGIYQKDDYILRQKARVISAMLLVLLGIDIFMGSYYLLYGGPPLIAVPIIGAFLGFTALLYMVRIGLIQLVGKLLLAFTLAMSWLVMFVDDQTLLMKLDTIAYIPAAFCLTSLVIRSDKRIIVICWIVNLILLVLFCYDVLRHYDVTTFLMVEYFIDNLIALFFVGVVSYYVVSINNSAMEKAEESISLAVQEAEKSHELSQNLEIKVVQRTKELQSNNEELQKEIKERKNAENELKKAQKEIIQNAHRAGMAEIATDTLHNVGNVLNSVKTSVYAIEGSLSNEVYRGFNKACGLLRGQMGDLDDFILKDPNGKKMLEYFLVLDGEFKKVKQEIENNLIRLNSKIDTIADVILAQHNYAGRSSLDERLNIVTIIEDAITIVPELSNSRHIDIIKDYTVLPDIVAQKTKLLHVFVNLLKNAVYAVNQNPESKKKINIKTYRENDLVIVVFSDTGTGIAPENLSKIFSHGYTTKRESFGFGLHNCANYLHEMGSKISAISTGIGHGASFRIEFPISSSLRDRTLST